MPFSRPTLTGLRNQAVQDVTTSGVPGLDGLLRNAVLRVLAWVMAGLAYSVYGYVDWVARMSVPFTAEDEYLAAWAALINVFQKDSTAATGAARWINNAPGTPLLVGAALTRQDGTPYTVTSDAVVAADGSVQVTIEAAVNGAATNCDPNTPINLDNPPPGINSGGLTVGYTEGGADQELQDAFRTRMLFKYAQPPQGGAQSDYIEWASEVPGITRAWAYGGWQGAGTVGVFIMLDQAQAANDGFPQGTDGVATDETRVVPIATGDQLTVANHIFPVQPVTALVFVVAPVPFPIDVTLTALFPNTPEIQASIIDSIGDMLLQISEPGGVVFPSQLYEAIQATPGVDHFTMSTPAAVVQAPGGALPVMGNLIAPPVPSARATL